MSEPTLVLDNGHNTSLVFIYVSYKIEVFGVVTHEDPLVLSTAYDASYFYDEEGYYRHATTAIFAAWIDPDLVYQGDGQYQRVRVRGKWPDGEARTWWAAARIIDPAERGHIKAACKAVIVGRSEHARCPRWRWQVVRSS